MPKSWTLIRSRRDRLSFNSEDGRHQLGASRPATLSADGVGARSTGPPASPHPGPPTPVGDVATPPASKRSPESGDRVIHGQVGLLHPVPPCCLRPADVTAGKKEAD